MTIIVVEDEVIARKAIVKKLKKNNEQDLIIEAGNGYEALARMQEYDIDLLITDIKMPIMDGLELLERTTYERIEKIILTGYAEFDYARTALQYGAKDYLLKPVNYEKLIIKVEELRDIREERSVKESIFSDIEKENLNDTSDYVMAVMQGEIERLDIYERDIKKLFQVRYAKDVYLKIFENPYLSDEYVFYIRRRNGVVDLEQCTAVFRFVVKGNQYIALAKKDSEASRISQSYKLCKRKLLRKFFIKSNVYEDPITDNVSIKLNYMKQMADYYIQHNQREDLLNNIMRSAGSIQDIEEIYRYLIRLIVERNENDGIWFVEKKISDFRDLEAFKTYIIELISVMSNECCQMDFVHQMMDYIKQHYNEDISLNEIALNKYYINPNYLSRKFKETMGISFKQYLLKIRMEKSRFLLQQNDLSVTEVASEVGYNSTSYFIKLYKSYFGCTPNQDRADDSLS